MNSSCREITVGKRRIGGHAPVFIIAEIGCNFEKSLTKAKEMIRRAASCGVDAVKFQTFIPEKLTTRKAKKFWEIEGCPGETQLEEFLSMPQLSAKQYRELQKEANSSGVVFFSTPCDEESVDMLDRIGVPLYKVSSMDITHIPLLKHIARKRKPVIISTGASTMAEIEEAVMAVRKEGNEQIAILHCITNYPTEDRNVNLRMLSHLKKSFPDLPVGYSDHTIPERGEGIIAAAVALGAKIIEKHFTFDNKRPGYDHQISADYDGFKRIVTQVRRVEKALGEEYKRPIEAETKARTQARRSIVAIKDILEGTVIAREMLEMKRPGTGIEPKFIDSIVGKKAVRDIKEDEAITWDMVVN